MLTIDTSTEYGARVRRRIDSDELIWLVTVDKTGTPQPSPVWFVPLDNDEILIYSQPDTGKLRNIAQNPRVALHLEGGKDGEDIVILTGEARVENDLPKPIDNAAYLTKYAEGIVRIGMTNETYSESYSVSVVVTPEKLRGH